MRYLPVSLSERRSAFSMASVYLFDHIFPSASPFVLFLFDFLVTEFTIDEITFIYVPRPLGSPSHYRRMKLATLSCFASSPLSHVLLFREELRPGVSSPPDHVPNSRTAIAIQPPFAAHLFYGLLVTAKGIHLISDFQACLNVFVHGVQILESGIDFDASVLTPGLLVAISAQCWDIQIFY
jgi:hypothetical protein